MHNLGPKFVVEEHGQLPPNLMDKTDTSHDREIVASHKERQRCDANWSEAKPPVKRIEVVNLNPINGLELEVVLNRIARERLGRS